MYDQVSPANADGIGLIVREPLGVVACVLPWNFPLMMLAWKIGPALAGGNSVIVKPAEQTSMTALRIAELAYEAGIPAGVLNILPGMGPEVGEPIGRHSGIAAVSFTGSTEIGRLFLQFSAQSNLKKVVLECGGKNPSIVLSDAENLDSVADHVVYAALWNMGQNCTANSRLIVHKSLQDELLVKIKEKLLDWHTGDPLDPKNNLGAIISTEQYEKILGYIESAKQEGAQLVCGGSAVAGPGLFIEPTLFMGVTADMTIAQEEVFGPLFGVMVVDSDKEAIRLANDTCYGLQASLFTSSVTKAHRYGRALQAGTVSVNCYGEGDITTPFGGYKLSGFGGRDNSLMAHDQYTETKTIWIDISGEISD
jgi:gamma-glutamyl-gamma-aminobutyraldehyde dehydrogenase